MDKQLANPIKDLEVELLQLGIRKSINKPNELLAEDFLSSRPPAESPVSIVSQSITNAAKLGYRNRRKLSVSSLRLGAFQTFFPLLS